MNIEMVLDALEKVRQNGESYTACCPVHDDKTPSMSLKEADGKVLIHCFGCGANGIEVVQALGLPTEVLFEETIKPDRRGKLIRELNRNRDFDEEVINILYHDLKNGKDIYESDMPFIKAALSRRQKRRKLGLPIQYDMEITF